MEVEEIRISKIANELLSDIELKLNDILSVSQKFDENGIRIDPDQTKVNELISTIEQFQPSPQLIDSKLRCLVDSLISAYIEVGLTLSSSATPSESTQHSLASVIGKVFYTLTKVRGVKTVSNCLTSDIYLVTKVLDKLIILDNLANFDQWQERYLLIVWLSVLILVPFPMASLSESLPSVVYELCFNSLKSNGKENDACSLLLSRMLSRNDCVEYLDQFIIENFQSVGWQDQSVVSQVGLLKVINYLLKLSTTQVIKRYYSRVMILICNEIGGDNGGVGTGGSTSTAVLRYYVKLLGKLGSMFCKSGGWDDVERALDLLIGLLGYGDSIIRYSVAKQISKISLQLPERQMVSDVISAVLNELDVPSLDTKSNANELNLQLDIDGETINIERFHGVLLTLGEFSRLRLLSSESACLAISLLHRTLFVEQHKLTHAVGSSVRDASCFVSWAISKKYKTEDLRPEIWTTLFQDLLLTCSYDRDLMIRRAAAAAIQELIGRHGDLILSCLVPNGKQINVYKIKLIELLDYTALGQLGKSFGISLSITEVLAGLMKTEFIRDLTERGIVNSNYEVRKRSAETLKRFLKLDEPSTSYIDAVLNSLVERYQVKPDSGLLYAIAELLPLSHSTPNFDLFHNLLSKIKFNYHTDPFYKGEEYIYLLYQLLYFRDEFQITTSELESIFIISRMNHEEVTNKFIMMTERLNKIPAEYLKKWMYFIKNGNHMTAKSVGYSSVLMTHLLDELVLLIEDVNADAELRSNLLGSISQHIKRNGIVDSVLFGRLIQAFDDYTITTRGDVGRFIRTSMIELVWENLAAFKACGETTLAKVELKLVRLAGEVMDTIRLKSLKLLLHLRGYEAMYIEYASTNQITYDCESTDDLLFLKASDYHSFLLELYLDKYLNDELVSFEFWKGYSFSAGSTSASASTANASIYSFIKQWTCLNDDQKNLILGYLLRILKIDKDANSKGTSKIKLERYNKAQSACLNFWCNLLELNLNIPTSFELRGLFVRTYNLTLGSSNMARLNTSIRLFTTIFLKDPRNYGDCKKRLGWLSTKHPIMKIRTVASNALEEIEIEEKRI
ncbi:hypothetical protein CANARDRAFT_20688 [[Candida] arabinofermentans NRRL YB-2248]|uniref:Tubulin-folding cofactor D ARM repeats domain-containing protein n=1 Tax=[Candida] arabinofermentans NRRL YB-2248 TaxID=983967 RepID=A0A1E4T891_9ASCO|nr:hypothetical protein CANARDRAFT_20688 [[Candida] arabinofermentans NRRL YB-2248]